MRLENEVEIMERLSDPLVIAIIFSVILGVIVAIVKLALAPAWRALKKRKHEGNLVWIPQLICIFFSLSR